MRMWRVSERERVSPPFFFGFLLGTLLSSFLFSLPLILSAIHPSSPSPSPSPLPTPSNISRVGVVMSGSLRSLSHTFSSILRNVVTIDNADVFFAGPLVPNTSKSLDVCVRECLCMCVSRVGANVYLCCVNISVLARSFFLVL